MDIETKLRELANLCRQAGEYTAWLAPKIEAAILDMAHQRTADDERRDVLAFISTKAKSYRANLADVPEDAVAVRMTLHAQATIMDAVLLGDIKAGRHVGAAERKETP